MSKIIAVIGGTGAQGYPIVKKLLAPGPDGSPSPWKIRLLTRNPTHHRAKDLEALGAELYQGTFLDREAVSKLLDGAYGAFVNTDTYTVGAQAETTAAFVIWELANWYKVRHFVWSNLEYSLRTGGYNPIYNSENHLGKGRFGAFLAAQPNPIDGEGTLWTNFTPNCYMEMLNLFLAPEIQPDGTRVFYAPMNEDSGMWLVSQADMAWWARYIFDNPDKTAGQELKITSAQHTYREIAETFTKVTGIPATYRLLTMDEFFSLWNGKEIPIASDISVEQGGVSWETHFRCWWAVWRDNVLKRDLDWLRSVHPGTTTLEQWMRDTKYDGSLPQAVRDRLLKNNEDHIGIRRKKLATLDAAKEF
ncbi:NAD-P-binding protein [Clavulina sp. PMI_390]|nr:NAD-P-binding protein [Clavulina sp. PMI_390]